MSLFCQTIYSFSFLIIVTAIILDDTQKLANFLILDQALLMICKRWFVPLPFTILLLLLIFELMLANGALMQVIVVHRHGARKRLTKDAIDPGIESIDEDLDVLYAQGETQLRRLGDYIRKYTDFEAVTSTDVIAYSSNTRRTMLSSRAFLNGLLVDIDVKVATMTFKSLDEDWLIRGYALCDRLADKFREFTETDEYNQHEKDDSQFVQDVARKLGLGEEFRKFEQVFNVYDTYVTQIYEQKTNLTGEEAKRLTDIANWYESVKFHFATHQVHVAGGLFRDIITRMEGFQSDSQERSEKQAKIVEYSAHYPTLLTLLATLRAENESTNPIFPADGIPQFGAALLLELHESEGSRTVALKWYPGGDNANDSNIVPIPFGLGKCSTGPFSCQLDILLTEIERFGLDQFCDDCNTKDKLCNKNTCGTRQRAYTASIAAIVGVIVGLTGALAYVSFTEKRKRADDFNRTGNGNHSDSDQHRESDELHERMAR